MARDGLLRLDLSNAILEEIGGVLRDKFHWRAEDVELAQREIASLANHVSPQETLMVIATDDDDNRIAECAAAARSHYLITNDKHLLRLLTHRGTRIVKPVEFLALLP